MSAARFLTLLGMRHTFLTFGEGGAKGKPRLTRTLHGTLAEHAETLAGLNARGAGVFVMVNEGDGKGRKATNVQRVRALFIDLDGAPLEPVQAAPLPAHCIVESSPGRWHVYWLVSDCRLDQFTPLQSALAARFNGDGVVKDLSRVMRLPGFEHRKREPFLSHVVALCERVPYTVAELVQGFNLRPATAQPKTKRALPDVIPEGERNSTLFSLAAGLVRKGFDAPAVIDRLQRINAERCKPPLCATEVDTISASASGYGSDGFTILPHKLQDSAEWKALPPPTQCIIVVAYRRFDERNSPTFALTWDDFNTRDGFRNEGVFLRHRAAAVQAGILIVVRKGMHTQQGITPTLYTIAERFRHQSQLAQSAASATCTNRQPYIDIQSLDAVAVPLVRSRRKTRKAA